MLWAILFGPFSDEALPSALRPPSVPLRPAKDSKRHTGEALPSALHPPSVPDRPAEDSKSLVKTEKGAEPGQAGSVGQPRRVTWGHDAESQQPPTSRCPPPAPPLRLAAAPAAPSSASSSAAAIAANPSSRSLAERAANGDDDDEGNEDLYGAPVEPEQPPQQLQLPAQVLHNLGD